MHVEQILMFSCSRRSARRVRQHGENGRLLLSLFSFLFFCFYFSISENRTRVKPLTSASPIRLGSFYFEEEVGYGNGSANKILLAHGDANTVSRADV